MSAWLSKIDVRVFLLRSKTVFVLCIASYFSRNHADIYESFELDLHVSTLKKPEQLAIQSVSEIVFFLLVFCWRGMISGIDRR